MSSLAILQHRVRTLPPGKPLTAGDIRLVGPWTAMGPQLVLPLALALQVVDRLNSTLGDGIYMVWPVPDLSSVPPPVKVVPLPCDLFAATVTDEPGIHGWPIGGRGRRITAGRLWALLGQAYDPFRVDWPERIRHTLRGWIVITDG